ncbi:AarF/ABC1/UbiB kinase family protein [Acidiferrimicrobium sp. IK]|uniref:ABC1 kinase family protein n=1 Tax=Acidiferrimicrobium sp. IK TaxID=2871700 RepID=UPI0021CAEA9C|nr:AarF/UbiB family protein [Acidiferrimicrobium sp. IK]MCU4183602.1 AarF/ABC1/UbiB kinase family protein [Acidiferrimicrobium sp. IK]
MTSAHEPDAPAAVSDGPADLADGAFSDDGPWVLDVHHLGWRAGTQALRDGTSRQVPELIRRRRLPPGGRVVRVGWSLGTALAGWYVVERRQSRRRGDPSLSRAGLSRRLRVAFERLGPTYIKLGQILSSGEGLFPAELVDQFKLLRDRVPAESFEDVRTLVEEELGRPIEAVFSRFDPQPLAAASIAQVHAATLVTGEDVVVKVQRPTVASTVRRDLAAMSWIAPALIGRIPVSALANPPALVELFAETIVEELDFRLEADNMLDVANVLATTGQRSLVVPRPHPELVTRRLLVMERLDGFSWDDVAGMQAAGIDTQAVVRALMIAFLEGAVLFGVFHGDLHGGNLFVRRDGRVALLDYGITGRLDESRRLAFLRMLMGGSINNPRMQLEALRDLGALPPDTDLDAVVKDFGLDRPPQDVGAMSPDELLSQVRDLTKQLLAYGARFPKVLMLFVKDLLFLDGALATLAPDVDLFGEVTQIATYFTARYGARIAADIGVDPRANPVDMDAVRAGLGVGTDVDALTYRDLQARRELIRKRMEDHRHQSDGAGRARRRWRRRS